MVVQSRIRDDEEGVGDVNDEEGQDAEAGDPMPGDLLIVDIGTDPVGPQLVRAPASQWTTVSWQPLANPDNPAAHAPEGFPSL